MVSVNQGGHGVYVLTPNACANDATTAFLAQGALPGRDLFCAAEAPPAAGATRQLTSARSHALDELRRRVR